MPQVTIHGPDDARARPRQTDGRWLIERGLRAGLLAGILMALVLMGWFWIAGQGLWTPMRFIAATFAGRAALGGGVGMGLLGLLTHLLVAAFWGLLFTAVLPRGATGAVRLALALVFSVGVFLLMTYVVLLVLNPVMLHQMDLSPLFASHLAFAGGLALFAPARGARGAGRRWRGTVGEPTPVEV